MTDPCCDLTIEEALTDPVIRAMMRADGVEASTLKALLHRVSVRRRSQGRSSPFIHKRPRRNPPAPIAGWPLMDHLIGR